MAAVFGLRGRREQGSKDLVASNKRCLMGNAWEGKINLSLVKISIS